MAYLRKAAIIPLILLVWLAFAFSPKWGVGDKYKGFIVTKSLDLAAEQCQLIELTHEETGAQVLYIHNSDTENFFSIAFSTPPENSRGAPHVLEHTVFQGTEKFPCRGLFHELKQRSLPTYMNAGTGPDFTSFHAASQIEADFYNLLSVYYDAVFHPLLRPVSFAQEGHRLELGADGLERKGVVFNEMKGKLASNRVLLMNALCEALFPDSHYRFNAGGDPAVIPELTLDELTSYHREHYFARNALFFFHGNLPLEKHLDFLIAQGLNHETSHATLQSVKKQPRFSQRVSLEKSYPAASESEPCFIGYSFLTCSAADTLEVLALKIVNHILMGSDAAPLKRALLNSKLCEQARASLDVARSEVSYSLCLEGVKPEDADEIDNLVFKTLQEVTKSGFLLDELESAINEMELESAEIGQGHTPFEQSPFIKCALLKLFGGKAEDGLAIQHLFDEIRQNPEYLQEIVLKHLNENSHMVRLVMKPSVDKSEPVTFSVTPDEMTRIQVISGEIRNPEPQDVNLPMLSLESIPKKAKSYEATRLQMSSLDICHSNAFTNHITYADLVIALPELAEDDLWLMQLFANLLTQVGSGGRTADEMLKAIQQTCGGIKAVLAIPQNAPPSLQISTCMLDRQAKSAFRLLYEMVTSANFQDSSRLREEVVKECRELENAIQQNALSFAVDASLAHTGGHNALLNKWRGLEYFEKIKALKNHFDEEHEAVIAKLQAIQARLFTNHPIELVITSADETFKACQEDGFGGLAGLSPGKSSLLKANLATKVPRSFAYLTTSPVAFTAKSFTTVSFAHPDSAALFLASHLFEHKVLRKRIREEGGAYGGDAIYNPSTGNFYFYSYRDPALNSTLKAFDEAVSEIAAGNFTEQDLQMAKFEAIQTIDQPTAPGDTAKHAYNRRVEGKSDALCQQFRDSLLAAAPADIQRVVQEHVVAGMQKAIFVTFASKELLERQLSLELLEPDSRAYSLSESH